jgi:hypothetical protein
MNNEVTLRPAEIQVIQEVVVRALKENLAEIKDGYEQTSKKVDILITSQNEAPLYFIDATELQNLIKRVGIRSLGGYKTPAYNDHHLRGKVYSDIHQQLRREYGVTSYKAIKRLQLDSAKMTIESYTAPMVLEDEIDFVNNQIEI